MVKRFKVAQNQLTITSVGNGGTRSGRVITWSGITLDAGATKTLTFTVHVQENTGNGYVLVNTARACSHDQNVCDDSSSDTTRVERLPQVISQQATHAVPVTAQTGAASVLVSIASLLGGASGFTYLHRRNK